MGLPELGYHSVIVERTVWNHYSQQTNVRVSWLVTVTRLSDGQQRTKLFLCRRRARRFVRSTKRLAKEFNKQVVLHAHDPETYVIDMGSKSVPMETTIEDLRGME